MKQNTNKKPLTLLRSEYLKKGLSKNNIIKKNQAQSKKEDSDNNKLAIWADSPT